MDMPERKPNRLKEYDYSQAGAYFITVCVKDKRKAISRIIKQMKEYVTKQTGECIWQKSFYDHIIRNDHDYREIWEYIDTNPLKRKDDDKQMK